MRMNSRFVDEYVPGTWPVPESHFGSVGALNRFPVGLRVGPGGMGTYIHALNFNNAIATVVPDLDSHDGLSGCGCGDDCTSCGPCRAAKGIQGLGTIDWSFTGSGISAELNTALNTSAVPAIPNWAYYGVGALILLPMFLGGKRRRR